jgi:hypothetical protein
MEQVHQGSCLCGAVQYHVACELKALTHCHCNTCRKGHGAAFATYASAPRSAVSVTAGGAQLKTYYSSKNVARQFCGNCGSCLFWSDSKGEFADWVSIAMGTLDTPVVSLKQRHACIESKVSWF